MFDSLFTWLLLPLGAVLGWVLARRPPDPATAASPDQTRMSWSGAEPAAAEDDAELSLILANELRKRGEVTRALRLHESLLTRADLAAELRHRARFELAQDYLSAGLMDRAQETFERLAAEGVLVAAALEQIVGIYEQGRDWQHAIEAARRLEAARGRSMRPVIAHYCCELAEEAQGRREWGEAFKQARRALDEDKDCVRASLLLGALHREQNDSAAAIQSYRRAFEQDARFLPELLTPLADCYAQIGDRAAYLEFLHEAHDFSSSALPLVAEAQVLRTAGDDATAHLSAALLNRPSRALLLEFLEVIERKPEAVAAGLAAPAASLHRALSKLLDSSPKYRCTQCGFTPRQLFWQCPTCKQWNTIAPMEDLLA